MRFNLILKMTKMMRLAPLGPQHKIRQETKILKDQPSTMQRENSLNLLMRIKEVLRADDSFKPSLEAYASATMKTQTIATALSIPCSI